jgi:hypothetical protein
MKERKNLMKKVINLLKFLNNIDWEKEKKYIIESKIEFYKVLINKINNNLIKRKLDPIFSVSKDPHPSMHNI